MAKRTAQLAAGALAALLLLFLKSKVRGKACAVKEESVRDKRATERALVNMMARIQTSVDVDNYIFKGGRAKQRKEVR